MSDHRLDQCRCAACLTPAELALFNASWLRDQAIKARRAAEQRAEAEGWEQEAKKASAGRSAP